MEQVFAIVGVGLLILSGFSGVALFIRAIGSTDSDAGRENGRKSTLWGLFLIGLAGGLLLLRISSVR